MSDAYFDNLRDNGEYPRKGYNWCDEESKRKEIENYISLGKSEPWILREAKRFGITVEKKP